MKTSRVCSDLFRVYVEYIELRMFSLTEHTWFIRQSYMESGDFMIVNNTQK